MKPKLTIEQQHRTWSRNRSPADLTTRLPTVLSQLVTVVYNSGRHVFRVPDQHQASAAVGVVFSLMALIHAIGLGSASARTAW
jgi:hypothetical protein